MNLVYKKDIANKIITYGISYITLFAIPLNSITYFAIQQSESIIIRIIPTFFTLAVLGLFFFKNKISIGLKYHIFIVLLFGVGIYTLLLGLLDMASLWLILSIIFAFFDKTKNLPLYIFSSAFVLIAITGILMIFKNPNIPIDYGFENCQFACVSIRIINFLIIGFLIFKILKMFFSTIDLYINEIIDKNIVLEELKISEKNEAEQKFKNQILKNDIEKQELELKYKHKELTNAFSKIIQFNNMLDDLKKELRNKDLEKISLSIKTFQSVNYSLERMIVIFNELYPQFSIKLEESFPQLTETDIKVCILLTSGLKSIEIAQILSVTEATVGKYRNRIRKKLELESNADIVRFLLTKFNIQ